MLEKKYDLATCQVNWSAGGKAHNVAVQLNHWKVRAISTICAMGSDTKAWEQCAKSDGVKILKIPVRVEMRKDWALVGKRWQRIDFFTPDPQIDRVGWAKIRKFWMRELKAGDVWVVAGSSAGGWPRGWWQRLIRDLRINGVLILVDSRGALLREALEAGVDWVKCNLNEAEGTSCERGVDRCLKWLRRKAGKKSSILLTLGRRGMVADLADRRIAVAATQIRIKDATGSGDVVTAGLIYGLMKGWTMDRTIRLAAEAGTRNASRADVGRVKRQVFAS